MVQERPVRVERRLAAILAADVAGYSRLMHHDEDGTHVRLTTLLADDVTPAIAEHGGRIVKNTGDGFLAEFPSAVEAVRCAVRFQSRIRELTPPNADDSRIAFRVGVNIGDIIAEPHDIFGDGVNIAARLESIAEPGGICISSSAFDQVRGKVEAEFADLGEQIFKNIARPVRAYAVIRDGLGSRNGSGAPTSLSAPRLSIVVLPFANVSGDPEQDYFADGVTESLTTDLSRIGGSFVIARNSAFSYKGKAIDVRLVGRDLNVRYVLEGSVQRSGKRLRVNVQLIDAESGRHLWAERFEKPVTDLFDLQDEVVSRLANTLDAQLIVAEARRAKHLRHPDAMDLYFQGMASIFKGLIAEHLIAAREFFERALAIDPQSVEALVGVAFVDLTTGGALLMDDRAALLSAAETNATRALSLTPDHAVAHMVLGDVYIFTNRAAQGIAECERALALNRNLAEAHSNIGFAKLLMGRAAETEGHIHEALRLSPRDVFCHRWLYLIGCAKLQLGADAEAAGWLRRSIEANRNYPLAYFALAAALGPLGALDEARRVATEGLALNPSFTVNRLRASKLSDNPVFLAGRERLCMGMCLAGVPEG
ncbi:adenylate/guanylate cyclase domain-containing protein [Bradyrhizobium sp. 23AC]